MLTCPGLELKHTAVLTEDRQKIGEDNDDGDEGHIGKVSAVCENHLGDENMRRNPLGTELLRTSELPGRRTSGLPIDIIT